jgi:hypothetical protein
VDRTELEGAIRSVSTLLAKGDPTESQCQAWFERNPVVFTCLAFSEVLPQPRLETTDGETYIPDFMVRDLRGIWHIFEIKTPDAPLLKARSRRQDFYAVLNKHYRQCREYSEYFDDSLHRQYFEEKYGYRIAKRPACILVAGRSNGLDRMKVHELLTDMGSKVSLLTYDDVCEGMEFFRAKQYARYEGLPGLTCFLAVKLHPADASFVLDIGQQRDRNRVSMFVDGHRLCCRVIDGGSDQETIRVPIDGRSLAYDQWISILLEIGLADDYSCLGVDVGGKHHSFRRVPRLDLRPVPSIVLGSDLRGDADSNFSLGFQLIAMNTLGFSTKTNLYRKIASYYTDPRDSTLFRDHRYLYSRGHPNFSTAGSPSAGKASDLIQPIGAHQPRMVKAGEVP